MKRVIWIDDERDPYQMIYYRGDKIERYRTCLPRDFVKQSQSDHEYDVIWIRDYDQFIDYIYHNIDRFDELDTCICFDHDLGHDMTGMDCAKYLIDYIISTNDIVPYYEVHSNNPAGKENIISYIESYKKIKDYE